MSRFLERLRDLRRPRLDEEHGLIVVALLVMAAVGGLALIFMQALDMQNSQTRDRVRDTRFNVGMHSGADTMLLAYRLAEISYNLAVSECDTGTARPFLEALRQGHGCPGKIDDITVFGDSDAKDSGVEVWSTYSYAYPNGCRIGKDTGIRCNGAHLPAKVVSVGSVKEEQRIDGSQYTFTLKAVVPAKGIAEFGAEVNPGTGRSSMRAFSIRGSLPNTAHIETDGRVTQESPDPLSRCPTEPWQTLQLYNRATGRCQRFVQLGGGNGLAYHEGRYFGFRPSDGQVIDLLSATTTNSYVVNPETGATCAGCAPVFPKYSKELLVNADDITTVGNQIYYVSQQGDAAHLGAISEDGSSAPIPPMSPSLKGGANRVNLCPLGKLGWGFSYVGIGATDWSDALLPEPGNSDDRVKMGTFYLKTDTRGMLTVTVRVEPKKNKKTPKGCTAFKYAGTEYRSCCAVYKDANIQQVEYLRTLGFDRTSDSKPYYVY